MVFFCRKHFTLLISIAALVMAAHVFTGQAAWAVASGDGKTPLKFVIGDFPRVQQLPNYCGPASLSTVLRYWGKDDQNQEAIGKHVYDSKISATNGADLLVYARNIGFSAYSFNGTISNIKQLLWQGLPIIVLQNTSKSDSSGHFRVVIGYDEEADSMFIFDSYQPDQEKISCKEFASLWSARGNWGLLVIPTQKDTFAKQMNDRNPVVHLDLAQAYYRKALLDEADREIRTALKLEPGNPDAQELLNRIQNTRGATGK